MLGWHQSGRISRNDKQNHTEITSHNARKLLGVDLTVAATGVR
jgi:hypothetical protein